MFTTVEVINNDFDWLLQALSNLFPFKIQLYFLLRDLIYERSCVKAY